MKLAEMEMAKSKWPHTKTCQAFANGLTTATNSEDKDGYGLNIKTNLKSKQLIALETCIHPASSCCSMPVR